MRTAACIQGAREICRVAPDLGKAPTPSKWFSVAWLRDKCWCPGITPAYATALDPQAKDTKQKGQRFGMCVSEGRPAPGPLALQGRDLFVPPTPRVWLLTSYLGLVPRPPQPAQEAPTHGFLSLPLQVCVAAVALYAPGTRGWLTTSSLRILRWVSLPPDFTSHQLSPSWAARGRRSPSPLPLGPLRPWSVARGRGGGGGACLQGRSECF